jgi:hypothetical protein
MQLEYVPGACNIGPEEIARRERVARIGLVATVALALLLLASGVGVGSPTRLLVGLPLTGAAIGWIQARRRFCMAYGLAGTFNLGAIGNMERVSSAAALAADRRTALVIVAQGIAVGTIGAAAYFAAPIG